MDAVVGRRPPVSTLPGTTDKTGAEPYSATHEACPVPPPSHAGRMELGQVVSAARDIFSARLVYGEPVEGEGVTVIPAATVFGGGGGGGGGDTGALPVREGAGFGVLARPVGAFVVRGTSVTWVPAVDVTRLGLVGALLALVKILAKRR